MSAAVHLRRRLGLVLLLAAVSPLVACSGESGERPTLDPSRSLTVTPSITATLPSPTRSLTRTPTETDPPTTDATDPPTSTDTSATPTPTASASESESESESEPTEVASSSAEPEPTPSLSPTPAAAEDEAGDGTAATPAWVWWLLGTLVLALAVGVPLLVRARRRSAWQERLSAAEAEVAWFARGLVPELRRSSTVERLAGGWAVSSGRVVALEDLLTSLVATAPDDAERARATELRDAVRAGRTRVESLAVAADVSELALDLDEVVAGLEAALRPAAPTP
ncbi:hypothetical protein [Nocardioides sp.]|uniref:hypothetical protein n=1 Tax=Nocardioides sp. TaxID=35761 RepID=UPI002ED0FE68